jgi:hypothetical protein
MVRIITTPDVNMRLCFHVVSRANKKPVCAFSVYIYVITLHFLTIPRADTDQVSVAEWIRDTDTLQQITPMFFYSDFIARRMQII